MLKMAKMKISLIEIKDSENVAIALKQIGLFDIVQINKVWNSIEIQIFVSIFSIIVNPIIEWNAFNSIIEPRRI